MLALSTTGLGQYLTLGSTAVGVIISIVGAYYTRKRDEVSDLRVDYLVARDELAQCRAEGKRKEQVYLRRIRELHHQLEEPHTDLGSGVSRRRGGGSSSRSRSSSAS